MVISELVQVIYGSFKREHTEIFQRIDGLVMKDSKYLDNFISQLIIRLRMHRNKTDRNACSANR